MIIRSITNEYYAISVLLFNSNMQKKGNKNVTNASSRKYNGFVTKVSISCF